MKHSELVRKLSKAGCYLLAHRKRHDEWYSPITGRTELVPRHQGQEVATGLANKILEKLLGQ